MIDGTDMGILLFSFQHYEGWQMIHPKARVLQNVCEISWESLSPFFSGKICVARSQTLHKAVLKSCVFLQGHQSLSKVPICLLFPIIMSEGLAV